jgi:hypothetical protein
MPESDRKEVNQADTIAQRADQVFAVLWVVLGLVVLIDSRGLEYMARYGPGPGFLIIWLGVGFIIMGLALLMQVTLRRAEREAFSIPSKVAAGQMCLVMIGFFAFCFLGDKIGFLLGIGLLFLFLLVVVERKGWMFSLAMSISITMVFWAIFELGLELRLPIGLFEFLR